MQMSLFILITNSHWQSYFCLIWLPNYSRISQFSLCVYCTWLSWGIPSLCPGSSDKFLIKTRHICFSFIIEQCRSLCDVFINYPIYTTEMNLCQLRVAWQVFFPLKVAEVLINCSRCLRTVEGWSLGTLSLSRSNLRSRVSWRRALIVG